MTLSNKRLFDFTLDIQSNV